MLISNQTKRELTLLHLIITCDETTFTSLSDELKLSKRRISDAISRLNRSFTEHLELETTLILSSKNGTIKINPELADNALTYFYQLKLALSNKSVLFQLCILLITKYKIHQDEIIEELFISKHYLVKLCQQLNDYLSVFDLSVQKNNQVYSIEGNELCYRLFAYLLLQNSFQGIAWPFDPDTSLENYHEDYENDSLTKNFSVHLIKQILKQRFEHKKFLLIRSDDPTYELLEVIMTNFDSSAVLEKNTFSGLNPAVEKSEKLYLNLFQRVFLSDIIPSSNKTELGRVFEEQKHEICQKVIQTYDRFSKMSLAYENEESSHTYLYYLTIFSLLYEIIGNKYLDFLAVLTPTPYLNIDKNDFYMESIRAEIDDLYEDKELLRYIASLLYTLSYFRKNAKLNIYIQMTKLFTSIYVIKQRLQMIFNPNYIVFTNNYSEADIVITDSFEENAENKTLFYLDTINNRNRWPDLITTIQHKLMDKLDSELTRPNYPQQKRKTSTF